MFRIRISCYGAGVARVFVRHRGLLQVAPAQGCSTARLEWRTRAQSDEGQWVTVNGPAIVYGTPRSRTGGRGAGWWATSSTWYFLHDGVASTVGASHAYACRTI